MNSGQFKLRYWTHPDAFDGQTPESRWALGLMAADGNVRAATAQIRFGQSTKNKDLIDAIKSHIGHQGVPYYQTSTDSYMLSWTNRRHVSDLAKYGIVDAKSLSYSLPSADLLSLDFLRGYVDGDGSIGYYRNGTHRKYLRISWVGTPDFIDQCAEWLGVGGTFTKKGRVVEICFSGKKAVEVGGLLYGCNAKFTSRKQGIYTSTIKEMAA